jgi:prepilin-type N-terminal cleavage/methylation domain-containing protein
MRASGPMAGGSRGWSLLELLIALVVLGIGITVFMRMQGRSSGISRANSNMQRASQLIGKHVESLRVGIARDPAAWPPKDTTYIDPQFSNLTLTRTVGGAISPRDGASLPGVRRIDLIVAWGNRTLDSMKVTTYVSKSF